MMVVVMSKMMAMVVMNTMAMMVMEIGGMVTFILEDSALQEWVVWLELSTRLQISFYPNVTLLCFLIFVNLNF